MVGAAGHLEAALLLSTGGSPLQRRSSCSSADIDNGCRSTRLEVCRAFRVCISSNHFNSSSLPVITPALNRHSHSCAAHTVT